MNALVQQLADSLRGLKAYADCCYDHNGFIFNKAKLADEIYTASKAIRAAEEFLTTALAIENECAEESSPEN